MSILNVYVCKLINLSRDGVDTVTEPDLPIPDNNRKRGRLVEVHSNLVLKQVPYSLWYIYISFISQNMKVNIIYTCSLSRNITKSDNE